MLNHWQNPSPQALVEHCQKVMAHAWMVRTFIKHSDEIEDFPELMGIVRAVFDTSRALETRVDDPAGYLHMLRKKLGKLKRAAIQFRTDAETASAHTNFQQAVVSMDACIDQLEQVLEIATASSGVSASNDPTTSTRSADSSEARGTAAKNEPADR